MKFILRRVRRRQRRSAGTFPNVCFFSFFRSISKIPPLKRINEGIARKRERFACINTCVQSSRSVSRTMAAARLGRRHSFWRACHLAIPPLSWCNRWRPISRWNSMPTFPLIRAVPFTMHAVLFQSALACLSHTRRSSSSSLSSSSPSPLHLLRMWSLSKSYWIKKGNQLCKRNLLVLSLFFFPLSLSFSILWFVSISPWILLCWASTKRIATFQWSSSL